MILLKILVLLIYWVFKKVLQLVVTAAGLAPVILLAYWGYESYLIYGDKIFAVVILFAIFVRRIATLLFIHVRFCSDGTSTYERLEHPEMYNFEGLPVEDKLRLFIMDWIGELRLYTDFKEYYPLPYGMGEGTKSLYYLRYSFLWTLIVAVFCTVWMLGYLESYWDWIIKGWVVILLVSATSLRFAGRNLELLLRFGRRFWYIRMTTTEILNRITFGLIPSNKRITSRRLFWCYFVGILIIAARLYYQSEFRG